MNRPNIVITLARKPPIGTVAQNALRYGTGGINIDGCRITTSEVGKPREMNPRVNRELWRITGGTTGTGATSGAGRWPANLILEHKPGCRCVGTMKAPATSSHGERTITRRSEVHSDAGGHQRVGRVQPFRGYGDESGTETIPAWNCEPGCPVAAMDRQSGIVPTGSWCRQKDTAHPFGNAAGAEYEVWQDVEEPEGGASRFFLQVQFTEER